MCGRTACALAPEDVVKACSYRDRKGKCRQPAWIDAPGGQQYTPAFNVAPGAFTPVLLSAKHLGKKPEVSSGSIEISDRVVMPMKWGLVPPWHQGDPNKVPYETNNCRAEGMLEKKTYKVPLLKGNRCVILAEGFFEWKSSKDGKQPYYFYFPQDHHPKLLSIKKENAFSDIKEHVTEKLEITKPFSKAEDSSEFCSDFPHEERNDKVQLQSLCHNTTNTFIPKAELCEIKTEPKQNNDVISDIKNSSKNEKQSLCKDSLTAVPIKTECLSRHVKQESIQDSATGIDNRKVKEEEDNSDRETPWQGPRLLTMAGVFDVWRADELSPPLYSYSVITVASSTDMDWCHHRMPAILSSEEEVQSWLDFSSLPLHKAAKLIKPKVCLSHHAVSKQVNSSRYQAVDTVKPVQIGQPVSSPGSKLMQQWLESGSPEKRKFQDLSAGGTGSKSGQVPNAKKKKQTGGDNFMMRWLKTGSPSKQSV